MDTNIGGTTENCRVKYKFLNIFRKPSYKSPNNL